MTQSSAYDTGVRRRRTINITDWVIRRSQPKIALLSKTSHLNDTLAALKQGLKGGTVN